MGKNVAQSILEVSLKKIPPGNRTREIKVYTELFFSRCHETCGRKRVKGEKIKRKSKGRHKCIFVSLETQKKRHQKGIHFSLAAVEFQQLMKPTYKRKLMDEKVKTKEDRYLTEISDIYSTTTKDRDLKSLLENLSTRNSDDPIEVSLFFRKLPYGYDDWIAIPKNF